MRKWMQRARSKRKWYILLRQNTMAFQAKGSSNATLYVGGCLKRRLMNKRVSICKDDQTSITALAANTTMSLSVATVTYCVD